jgi:hypothetical protein
MFNPPINPLENDDVVANEAVPANNDVVEPVYALIEAVNEFNDAVVANEPVLTVTAEPVATVKLNVVPLPSVNVITLLLTEAVVNAFEAEIADDAVNEFIDAVNVFIDAVNAFSEAVYELIEALNAWNEDVKVNAVEFKLSNKSAFKAYDDDTTEPD